MPTTWEEGGGGDFVSWLAAREPALHRLATLLTLDPYAGRDLLRPVLARLCLDWGRIGAADAEDRARELLLAEHRRTWDRRASDSARIRLAEEYDGADAAAWALVGSLPARERAIVVVRHHDQLDDVEAGRLLRLPTALVRAEDQEVLTALRLQLDRQRVRHPERSVPADAAEVLTETLRAHAEETTYVPSDPDEIGAIAAATRGRRRRTTTLSVVTSVIVVAALVTLVDPLPATPARPEPRPEAVAAVGPLDEYETGGPPGVPYLVGNVLVAVDGSRRELPIDHPRSATPYRGDLWVTELYYDVTDTLHRIDASGTQLGTWPTSGDPVVSADGQVFAWVEVSTSGKRRSLVHRGRTVQEVGKPIWLTGLLGDRVVYNGTRKGGAWVTDLTSPPRRIPGLALARGVDPATGAVSGTSDNGDGVVVDARTGEIRWQSSRWRPESFSPDGRHVVAISTTRRQQTHAILEAATGRLVGVVNRTSAWSLFDLRWEDDEHVLTLASALGETALLRVDLAGNVTIAAPSLPIDVVGSSAYQFAVR